MKKYKSKPKSKYYGVRPDREWFRASIMLNSKSLYLGVYETEEEAALAFNWAYFHLGSDSFSITNNVNDMFTIDESIVISENVERLLKSKNALAQSNRRLPVTL